MGSEERRNIWIGAAMVAAFLALIVGVHIGSAHRSQQGYRLVARFHKAEGVSPGTEVRLYGMVVGKVAAQTLDDQFRAVLTLQLAESVALPADSDVAIKSDSLFGSKFVSLQPGGDDKNLKPGDEIANTQDSLALRDVMDMIIAQGESVRGLK